MSQLFNNLLNQYPYLNVADTSGGPKEPLSKGGILDELNNDADVDDKISDNKDNELDLDLKDDELDDKEADVNDKKEPIDKDEDDEDKDDKDKKDEEKDELKELEDELKDRTDDELELTTPVKKREILAKYPDVFKDFPSLETAYYRELEFTKIFPTIADAKDGASAVNTLAGLEADLRKGNTVNLFKAIVKDDPKAFAYLADSYMENLAQVDEKAYHHVLGNITKDIVETMFKTAKKSSNKELGDAATTLYQFMFGDVEWKPKAKLAIDDANDPANEKLKDLERREQEFEKTKFNERQTELMTGVDNRIKSVIDQNIDKKAQMTPFVKKTAVREVKEKLDSLIKADSRFQTIVKRLWDKARESKYSRDSLNTIESAHVSKAKSLLPTVIVSVKKEALKGNSVERRREKDTDNKNNENNENTSRTSTASRTKVDSTKIDKNKPLPGESSLDFLSR